MKDLKDKINENKKYSEDLFNDLWNKYIKKPNSDNFIYDFITWIASKNRTDFDENTEFGQREAVITAQEIVEKMEWE